ncbi:MAG: hypothetical protein EBS01_15790, partial [Verrucomicrobia bacterium]|nr:hypothetical protein [Verrucomicrobiota bacterium]
SAYQEALRRVVYRNAKLLTTETAAEGRREISIVARAESAEAAVTSICAQLVVSLVSSQGPPVPSLTVLPGSTLSGSGSYGVLVVNDGAISPGHSPGFQDYAAYSQTAKGLLHMELAGTSAGTLYDQIRVTGAASLDGTLEIALLNGFTPSAGQTFDILTFGSATGKFSQVTGLAGFGDGSVQLELVEHADRLQLVARPSSTNDLHAFVVDKLARYASHEFTSSLTFGGLDLTLGGVVRLTNTWITFSDSGAVSLTASSAALFPDRAFNAAVSDGGDADSDAVNASYVSGTGIYQLTLDQFVLTVGDGLKVSGSNFDVTFNSNNPGADQVLTNLTTGSITSNLFSGLPAVILPNLTLRQNGFAISDVNISTGVSGTASVGDLLSVTGLRLSVSNFSVTYGNGTVTVLGAV